MNISCSRDIFVMKWIITKQSGSPGKVVVSMPGSFGEQVDGMDWVSSRGVFQPHFE